MKIRLHAMAVSTVIGILTVNFMGYKLNPSEFDLPSRAPRIALIILVMIGAVVLNFRSQTLLKVKLTAFLASACLLVFFSAIGLLNVSGGHSFPFSSTMMISIFFVALMIPWRVKEVFVVSFLHILVNALYYHTVGYIETGNFSASGHFQPFLETFLLISVATVFCVSIRYQETSKDIKEFVLRKNVESQKKEIQELNKQMKMELELASKVHQTLIPKDMESPDMHVSVTYLPMSDIGGDYAKFTYLDDNRAIFLICDVTGHGIPAALIVNRVHAEFENLLNSSEDPDSILNELNHFIQKNFESTGMLLSAFCIRFDFRIKKAVYCNYGHPDQLHLNADGEILSRLKSNASLLGIQPCEEKTGSSEVRFHKGDRFILFTDGLTECSNETGEEFGDTGLAAVFKKYAASDNTGWTTGLLKELNRFRSGHFQDDIFVLNIRIR